MPRLRPTTIARLHNRFGDTALAWTPDAGQDSLRDYIEQHGVAHLLTDDRRDDAEQRMLDLHFMAAFADAWPTVVEPLAAWRTVGLESARDGFARLAAELPAVAEADEADA